MSRSSASCPATKGAAPRRPCSGCHSRAQSRTLVPLYKHLVGLRFLGSRRSPRLRRNDDDGLRAWAFVGERYVDLGLATGRRDLLQPFERAAGQLHGGAARGQIDHAHVAPEHAAAETSAERLGAGFLGGKTLGIDLDRVGAILRLGAFGGREKAPEKTFAVTLDAARDAPYVDHVGAEPEDHTFSLRMILSENRYPSRVRPGTCCFGIMRGPSGDRGPWPRA